MAKHIVYGDKARQAVLRGINQLADAVTRAIRGTDALDRDQRGPRRLDRRAEGQDMKDEEGFDAHTETYENLVQRE